MVLICASVEGKKADICFSTQVRIGCDDTANYAQSLTKVLRIAVFEFQNNVQRSEKTKTKTHMIFTYLPWTSQQENDVEEHSWSVDVGDSAPATFPGFCFLC